MVARVIGISLGFFMAYMFTKMANPAFDLNTWMASLGR